MILLIKIIFLFDQKIIKIDIHMKCKKNLTKSYAY